MYKQVRLTAISMIVPADEFELELDPNGKDTVDTKRAFKAQMMADEHTEYVTHNRYLLTPSWAFSNPHGTFLTSHRTTLPA